jgi:hypothetical protein
MTTLWHDVTQGSDEWEQLRIGRITASEMHRLVTPTGKKRTGETPLTYATELAAQRVCGWVDQRATGAAIERGHRDEVLARELYRERVAPVEERGFATRGCIGYSPDGLVGDDGLIEIKSRIPRLQLETVALNRVPEEHIVQVQTGLFVTGREWCDYISYCSGMPMYVRREYVNQRLQSVILEAAEECEMRLQGWVAEYREIIACSRNWPTERIVEGEMHL